MMLFLCSHNNVNLFDWLNESSLVEQPFMLKKISSNQLDLSSFAKKEALSINYYKYLAVDLSAVTNDSDSFKIALQSIQMVNPKIKFLYIDIGNKMPVLQEVIKSLGDIPIISTSPDQDISQFKSEVTYSLQYIPPNKDTEKENMNETEIETTPKSELQDSIKSNKKEYVFPDKDVMVAVLNSYTKSGATTLSINLAGYLCGKLMACIHGSDAHQNDKLFEPDNQRYCWIKADPTFNGLKQIVYEPEERVRVFDSKPQTKSPYQVIESITITDNDFQTEPIVFNDKLNCIIGGKSTGKSILLHNLARAIAPKQVQEKCEVSTGGKSAKSTKPLTLEIDTSKLNVRWSDGESTNGQTIVYIPQTYLNRLADSVQETTEIDEIIEKVLLDRTDGNGMQLSIKKAELISIADSIKSSNINKILEIIRIHSHIKELTNQITELGGKKPVEQELSKLHQERDVLTKELNIKEDDIKKYDDAVANIEVQKKLIEQHGKEIEKVENATIIVQQIEQFTDCSDETSLAIKTLIDDIITKANDSWNNQKENIISRLKMRQSESNKSCYDSVLTRDGLKGTIESNNRIKELAEKITKEGDKLKKIEEKEKARSEEKTKIDTLVVEVAGSYISIRSAYEDFAAYIKENTANDDSGLQYDVQIPFRQNDFLVKWSELYRAASPQNRSVLNVDDFTAEKYTEELLSTIIKKTLNGELTTLKAGAEPEQALRNILDDWYNIKYIVKMGNDSIDVMSPGKKALVLLQLLIDLADSECPILIDQPEDDLDNRSIFEQLIPFIKRKKVNRQIIVVTHNANIVVGADAEEVIVANQDGIDSEKKSRRFEYRSGAIENDYPIYKPDGTTEDGILNKQGIQQHICDILEGGIKAFEKRKNKYHI